MVSARLAIQFRGWRYHGIHHKKPPSHQCPAMSDEFRAYVNHGYIRGWPNHGIHCVWNVLRGLVASCAQFRGSSNHGIGSACAPNGRAGAGRPDPLLLPLTWPFFAFLYLAVWHWSLPLPLDLNSLPQSRAEGGFRRFFEKTPKYPCSTKSLPKGSQVGRPVKISKNAKKCRKASNNCHDTSVTHFWGVLGHFIFFGKISKNCLS